MRVDNRGRRRSRRWLQSTASRRAAFRVLLLVSTAVSLYVVPLTYYLVNFRHTPYRPLPPSRAGFQAIRDMALAVPDYYLHWLTGGPEVPAIYLNIEFKHLEKLIKKRSEALRTGVLIASDDDLVPAVLSTGEEAVRVKMRLKGDILAHLSGERWSFRIEVRDGANVFGMRRFSLQAPYIRGFQREALYFDFLRSRGILAPRHFFVDLYVNGRRIGITALEEHFSKELPESQQRREGVILKFDESYYWEAVSRFGGRPADYWNWRSTPVTAFGMRKIRESEELSRQAESALGLLRGVVQDRIAPSRAFDAELWGEYLAACEIWSAGHAVTFRNVRMYFNPLTFRLEPIGFDASGTFPTNIWPGLRCQGAQYAMMDHLFADPRIRRAFFSGLKEMTRVLDSTEFLRTMQARERQHLEVLRTEFPWLQPIDWSDMRRRAHSLLALNERNYGQSRARILDPTMNHSEDADYPAVVHAYLEFDGTAAHLEIDNPLSRPVTVTELRFQPDSIELRTPLHALLSERPPYRLGPSKWPERPETVRIRLERPAADGSNWSVAGVAMVGSDQRRYPFRAHAAFPALSESPVPRVTLAQALDEHSFLERDPGDPGWLRAKPGTWDVVGWLVLPENFGLRLAAGTTLRFEEAAALVARGPLDFRGEHGAPVVLEAQPRPAEAGVWGGVLVLSSEEPSFWSHVVVRNTTGVARGNWMLTGGVTFRRADVELSDSLFDGSRAEDELNLIRSRFTLRRVEFRDAASDALDADFCEGRIEGGAVRRAGGDGIDLGGAQVEIDAAHFEGVRDKALSVGEGSTLRARNLRVESSRIGLASKDASQSFVEASSFENIEFVALAAYVKKRRFGGAELVAENVQIDTAGRIALAQQGSRVSLNGAEVLPESVDVADLYESAGATR